MIWVVLLINSVLWNLSCGQQGTYIAVFTQDGNGGVLDVDTGEVLCLEPIPMPQAMEGCEWNIANGTRGQTSATFPLNDTYFFLAQEVCENGSVGDVCIFQAYGPYPYIPCEGFFKVIRMAQLPTYAPMESFNMAWDHTCNVVTLVPSLQDGQTVIQTKQVSEYDGADRPQPDYSPVNGSNCWKKVDGLGALDYGSATPSWPPGKELNCGDTCVFYTLEQCNDNVPRALIGKYYRTGQLAYNITDSVQIQTMSYVPFFVYSTKLQQFLGIGICCTEDWCHKECQGLDNRMVLVKFVPSTQEFSILDDIGEIDPKTVQLGVGFSSLFSSKQRLAFVYHDNTVISYILITNNNNEIMEVQRRSQHEVQKPLSLWAGHN